MCLAVMLVHIGHMRDGRPVGAECKACQSLAKHGVSRGQRVQAQPSSATSQVHTGGLKRAPFTGCRHLRTARARFMCAVDVKGAIM